MKMEYISQDDTDNKEEIILCTEDKFPTDLHISDSTTIDESRLDEGSMLSKVQADTSSVMSSNDTTFFPINPEAVKELGKNSFETFDRNKSSSSNSNSDNVKNKYLNSTELYEEKYLSSHLQTHLKDEQDFFIDICDEKIPLDSNPHHYVESHVSNPVDSSKTVHSFEHLNNRQALHSEQIFPCSVCKKLFNKRVLLLGHLVSKHLPNSFSCTYCKRKFATKKLFEKHFNSLHRKLKWFCRMCRKYFKHKDAFDKHTKLHSLESVLCYDCGMKFNDTKILNRHLCRGEFQCYKCQKSFSKMSSLFYHLGKSHKDLQYACRFCTKKFMRSSILQKHLMIRHFKQSLLCYVCSKTFKTLDSYNEHSKVHLNSRMYSCCKCNGSFDTIKSLKYHRNEHIHNERVAIDMCTVLDSNVKNSLNKNNPLKHVVHKDSSADSNEINFNSNLENSPNILNSRIPVNHKAVLAIVEDSVSSSNLNKIEYNNRHKRCNKENKILLCSQTHKHKSFTCSLCDYNSTSQICLERHLDSNNAVYNDSVTHKFFITKDLSTSKQIPHGGAYISIESKVNNGFLCNICGKKFNELKHLLRHSLRMHKRRGHSCNICSKNFKHQRSLDNHITAHSLQYSCEPCGKKFRDKSKLRQHIETHFGIRHHEKKKCLCHVCGKILSCLTHLRNHLSIHLNEKRFPCSICSKKFRDKSNQIKHEQSHTGKTYSCKQCNKEYRTRDSLRAHIRRYCQDAAAKYSCHLCDKKFKSEDYVAKHISAVHYGARPFICNVCDKSFKTRGCLTKHLRVHSGETPFTCDTCGKKFKESGQLRKHMRIHSDVKRFSCQFCDKKFNFKCALNAHLPKHSKGN